MFFKQLSGQSESNLLPRELNGRGMPANGVASSLTDIEGGSSIWSANSVSLEYVLIIVLVELVGVKR